MMLFLHGNEPMGNHAIMAANEAALNYPSEGLLASGSSEHSVATANPMLWRVA